MVGFVHTRKRVERLGFDAASESNVPPLHPVCIFQHGAGMQIHLPVPMPSGRGNDTTIAVSVYRKSKFRSNKRNSLFDTSGQRNSRQTGKHEMRLIHRQQYLLAAGPHYCARNPRCNLAQHGIRKHNAYWAENDLAQIYRNPNCIFA